MLNQEQRPNHQAKPKTCGTHLTFRQACNIHKSKPIKQQQPSSISSSALSRPLNAVELWAPVCGAQQVQALPILRQWSMLVASALSVQDILFGRK